MKKQHIIYLISGVAILVIAAAGLYTFRYRSCLKQINYVPPREQGVTGGGFSGLRRVANKGDYYRFDFREFRTSDDAMRACIWK